MSGRYYKNIKHAMISTCYELATNVERLATNVEWLRGIRKLTDGHIRSCSICLISLFNQTVPSFDGEAADLQQQTSAGMEI
jgi:hypothetical protein